jgi:phosphoenolpyruvate carboxylase
MTRMSVYDHADLTAIQIVREAVTDDTTTDPDYDYAEAVHRHVAAVAEQHGTEGLTAVAAVLARMVQVALMMPKKRPEKLAGVLDGFERDALEEHRSEQDSPVG